MTEYPSQVLCRTVDELSRLPGVGRKTALRLALFLLRRDIEENDRLATAISELCHNIHYCHLCHNISETTTCSICGNPQRDHSTVCVVATIQDVLAIENTQHYKGVYHVLGGVISPLDGITPEDLEIDSLVERIATEDVREVIIALSSTMEGDTTTYYIARRLADHPVVVSIIARGISLGNELEYTDEATLAHSIDNRTPFIDARENS